MEYLLLLLYVLVFILQLYYFFQRHTHTHTHTYIYIYVYTCVYTHTHTHIYIYIYIYINELQLKSSKADQDTIIQCEQMGFIFQYSPPWHPHISLNFVAVLRSFWQKKGYQQQIRRHHLIFFQPPTPEWLPAKPRTKWKVHRESKAVKEKQVTMKNIFT